MKKAILKLMCVPLFIVGIASCTKDEKVEDCSSDIIASYSGNTDCQSNGAYNGVVTINSTGESNKVTISNLGGVFYPVNATINCSNKTITIPEQTVGEPSFPLTVSGNGTYTANSVTITFNNQNIGGGFSQCIGTYFR